MQRYVRKARYKDYFNIGIHFSDLAARLHTVDTRRHAHIQNDDVEWIAGLLGSCGDFDRVIALRAGNNIEYGMILYIGIWIE